MLLVDTDILIWVLRGDNKYLSWFKNLHKNTALSISTVTIAEIYKNTFPSELLSTEAVIDNFVVLNVTASIAKQAGLYWQEYNKKLIKLNITDCLIASTSLVHDSALITLNTKHFPMQNITVLEPKDI